MHVIYVTPLSHIRFPATVYDGHPELKCHLKTYLQPFKDIWWKTSLKLQLFQQNCTVSLSIKA